ncbi:hypothetical protein [Luminiphilus syltensis]|uniref:hypothetical protein n=1 Tax=Luminiphilus syltensis TaxID=1341119 RepID=UPI00058FF2C9
MRLAVFFALNIDVHLLYQILIGIISWFFFVAFHYSVWRKILVSIADKVLAPTITQSGVDGLIGRKAIVKEVDGKILASIQGDLWPFKSDENLAPGGVCQVGSVDHGTPILKRHSEEK